jgi:transketolase
LTHCGLDVGEDGKTHQCIDYIGLAANLYGFKLIIPADANQTDRVIRYVATTPGRFIVAMGRSKVPMIMNGSGVPIYAGDYDFEYGRADWVRNGRDAVIVASGTTVSMAIKAADILTGEGYNVGVLNLSCPLELDEEAIRMAAATGLVATYEDHNIRTGIGSIIGTYLMENRLDCRFMRFGITEYGISGTPEDNYKHQKLDPESIAQAIASKLK